MLAYQVGTLTTDFAKTIDGPVSSRLTKSGSDDEYKSERACRSSCTTSFSKLLRESLAAAVEGQAAAIQVESEVMWYTTMALDDSSVLVEKFKAKYPKVSVKLFRANNSKILERILAESRAKSTMSMS